MKSSTLRRANLSKEKIEVLEKLAKYRRQTPKEENLPTEPIKDKEIDILWNFKHHNKHDKSPTVYLITGFITGVLVTLLVTILIQVSLKTIENTPKELLPESSDIKTEQSNMPLIPTDKETVSLGDIQKITTVNNEETYTVQEGDTLESIIIKFYGSFSLEHVKEIKEANKLKNPNALSIGQKLIIPMR